ncbi:Heme oxygenase 1 [Psilocybe cubensis]|uniref:Heme oxygenase 1 n=1 Tax=Psilocybe cubensis TaxID=181762 RepID=A0ACB8GYP1_PSICU|nr:Heme oxygenase 1 [Psilocybe cubensis]KAH9480600.1 Heme oxygenase 1 [Psilocybe cubensis]
MPNIDYSKPLATLLRESTHEAHDQVAMSQGAKLLLSGGLSKEDYTRVLERALERHATNQSLEPTHNPALLARAPSLSADISHLLQVDEGSWKDHPIHVQLLSASLSPLDAYLRRLEELSKSSDPSALLAHSYVRYLGDLSGGQVIRHTLAKAYGLDESTGLGLSFYAFKELRSSKPANQGEMKRIKEWFREGMNTAGERGVEIKTAVVEEANTAFKLNAGLFELLDRDWKVESIEKAKTHVVFDATQPTEKAYPLSTVVAVIAAVCLSHFVLTVGGFTGDKGYEKLLSIEQWFASIWQQTSQ